MADLEAAQSKYRAAINAFEEAKIIVEKMREDADSLEADAEKFIAEALEELIEARRVARERPGDAALEERQK